MHARARGALLACVAVLPLLAAGCSGPGPAESDRAAVEALHWPTLNVRTTPAEAFDETRPIQVSWQPGLTAIWAEREPSLRPRMVRSGDTVYVNSNAGMGWTQFGIDDQAPINSDRLQVWDLPRVLAASEIQVTRSGSVLNVTAQGEVKTVHGSAQVTVEVGALAGQVIWARLSSPTIAEAPFTFRYDGVPLPFTPAPHPEARTLADVSARNQVAATGHADVITLLKDYARNHGCAVPDKPTSDSLAIELLAANKKWPDNAFTGAPLAVGNQPGDIGWTKSGPTDANYTGWGWDGALVTQGFRATCRA